MNVLISSAGRRVALLRLFRRTLADLGLTGRVLAADMSALSAAFHEADEGFVVPRCTSEEFVPEMLELCRRHRVGLVIPTIDPELAVYAAHRDEFAEIGTTVAVSTPEVVAIGGDKQATHQWLTANGLPAVAQGSVEEARSWPLPVVVKPRFGSASIGLSVVRTDAQWAAVGDEEMIVQKMAPGVEHTLDVLADRDGRCCCVVPRRRLEVRAGEVSKAVTVRSQPLIDLGRALCEALPGAYGALNVQVFVAGDEVRVIELNARFGGGFPLAWEAGAPFPRWIIEELLGEPVSGDPAGWRDGLVMLRYDDAVFRQAPHVGLAPGR